MSDNKDRTFTKGEKVRVTRKSESRENGWIGDWKNIMNKYIGQVLEVIEDEGEYGVKCSVDNGKDFWHFPHFVLEMATENKDRLKNTKIWVGDDKELSKKVYDKLISFGIDWNSKSVIGFQDGVPAYLISNDFTLWRWVGFGDESKLDFLNCDSKELTPSELLGEEKEEGLDGIAEEKYTFVDEKEADFYIAVERIKLLRSEIQSKQTELNELIDKLKTL